MKIKTNGIELNYVVEGKGPWLLMSHSLACDLTMWTSRRRCSAQLQGAGASDTRGHGQSDAPKAATHLDMLAYDVHGLLQGLGVESLPLGGSFDGRMIGQTFALKFPGMFSTMVLADTTSRYAPEALPLGRVASRRRDAGHGGPRRIHSRPLVTEPFRKSIPRSRRA